MDKGKHGFDGQKCAHASSKPLAIQAYALRAFPRLDPFLLRQNCVAPASDVFSSDFCSLKRRRAGARQAEKGQKAPERHAVRRVCPCPSMLPILQKKTGENTGRFKKTPRKHRNRKMPKNLQYWAFEKKYKAKTEL